ncbi:MAG: class I SAM-dependent methyltransferase [Pseudomonadota bacterium]
MEYGAPHAELYDEVFRSRGKDYRAEVEGIIGHVREQCPGARSLLDVACGTGQHLFHFAERFEHVEGVDLSPHMLERAQAHVPSAKLHVGDMRTLDVGRTFDVVNCSGNAISELRTLEALTEALRRMTIHLADGGVLVVEPWYFEEHFLEGHVGGHLFESDGRVVSRVTHVTRVGDLAHHTVAFTVAEATGIRRFEEVLVYGLFTQAQYVDAFRAAGVTAQLVPGFCLADGRPNSPGLFVATRS